MTGCHWGILSASLQPASWRDTIHLGSKHVGCSSKAIQKGRAWKGWFSLTHSISCPICSMYGILWYIYLHLGGFLGQMLVNIPYMEHMGVVTQCHKLTIIWGSFGDHFMFLPPMRLMKLGMLPPTSCPSHDTLPAESVVMRGGWTHPKWPGASNMAKKTDWNNMPIKSSKNFSEH